MVVTVPDPDDEAEEVPFLLSVGVCVATGTWWAVQDDTYCTVLAGGAKVAMLFPWGGSDGGKTWPGNAASCVQPFHLNKSNILTTFTSKETNFTVNIKHLIIFGIKLANQKVKIISK